MFGAMDLGIADDGKRAGREQAAQIAIRPRFSSGTLCSITLANMNDPMRRWLDPGGHVASGLRAVIRALLAFIVAHASDGI